MGLNAVISICIPTYNRPALLQEAIESCLLQQYRPLEIVIGDDSTNDDTEELVARLALPPGVSLQYRRHTPSLGQSSNVNDLFARATGSRLLLLHDDDLLCPGGLDRLERGWTDLPGTRCIYGNQYVVAADGALLADETESVNRQYFRMTPYAGRQASGLTAGLWQQMPNDCFLIESDLARTVGYRQEEEMGQCVDVDFAIRVGMAAGAGEFVFLDEFISKYRLTEHSIMRNRKLNHGRHLLLAFIESLPTKEAAEEDARQILLRRLGLGASLDAATAGHRSLGLRIMMSRYYTKPFFSRWTMYRLLCIASPRLAEAARRVIRG